MSPTKHKKRKTPMIGPKGDRIALLDASKLVLKLLKLSGLGDSPAFFRLRDAVTQMEKKS